MLCNLRSNGKNDCFLRLKNIDMSKLGCTLPNPASICLHISIYAKFCPLTWEDEDFVKKDEKMFLVLHLSFFYEKQLLMKLLFKNQQYNANILLGLTLANYTLTRCINSYRPVFIRVGISIQKPVDSHLDKTSPVALKIWSCLTFNE